MLEQGGEATVVAEPRLSCRSGGAARFVAGGEIPVPVVNGVGSTDVEYREYGVILDIKPIADASGAIFARIETELSQIDGAQRVNGVPGLLKRRSTTDVNVSAAPTTPACLGWCGSPEPAGSSALADNVAKNPRSSSS
jgi:pilus assembly protein CpaC